MVWFDEMKRDVGDGREIVRENRSDALKLDKELDNKAKKMRTKVTLNGSGND